MSKFDEQYIDLCKRIFKEGEKITNYQKSDKRSAKVAQAIPDHTALSLVATTTMGRSAVEDTGAGGRLLHVIS